jgi:hypothetical protein
MFASAPERRLPPGSFALKSPWIYRIDVCPMCGKSPQKCWFDVQRERGGCWACGGKIYSWSHLEKLCGATLAAPPPPPLVIPGTNRRPWSSLPSAWDIVEAREYLIERGLDEDQVRSLPIEWLPEHRCMVLEVDRLSPDLPREWWRRRPEPGSKWISWPGVSASSYLFGVRFLRPDLCRVLVMEGIFDVLSPRLEGFAVALLGTKLSLERLVWLRQQRFGDGVILWLDADAAGERADRELSQTLKAWGIPVVSFRPGCDPKTVPRRHQWIHELKALCLQDA